MVKALFMTSFKYKDAQFIEDDKYFYICWGDKYSSTYLKKGTLESFKKKMLEKDEEDD